MFDIIAAKYYPSLNFPFQFELREVKPIKQYEEWTTSISTKQKQQDKNKTITQDTEIYVENPSM